MNSMRRASRRLGAATAAALVLLLLLASACSSTSALELDDAEQMPTEGTFLTVVPPALAAATASAAAAAAAQEAVEAMSLETLNGVVHAAAAPAPPPPTPIPPPYLGSDQPVPPPQQIMKDTLNCSGFAQPRTYIEAQAWFTRDMPDVPDAVNTQSMHLHIGACVPHRQWVSGTVKLAVLVQRHGFNVPDITPVNLRVEVERTSSTGAFTRMTTYSSIANENWVCDTATDLARLCKQVVYMDVLTITANMSASEGVNIFRLVGSSSINDTVSPKLRSMETRIVSNIVLWNNQKVALAYPTTDLAKVLPPSQLSTTGHPWAYTHAEYLSDIPLAPLVGNVTLKASSFSATNTANVTGLFIAVDPAFHQVPVNPGKIVIRNYTTAQVPNAECKVAMLGSIGHVDCKNLFSNITINTRLLDDTKWHKLFIRTDAFVSNDDPIITTRVPRVGGGTFSAVVLMAFRVNNTGNVIAGPQPVNSSLGSGDRPPDGFNPPAGVKVFDGSQPLPDTGATLNIASTNYNCSGWLEPRVYLEGGAWFTQPYQAIDYANGSQLLVGACLPHGQKVAGKVPVDILLQKRNFPSDSGLNVKLVVQLDWAKGNLTYRVGQNSGLTNWTCSTPDNCRTIISIQVDTKPSNGTYVAPDGPQAVTVEASTMFNWGTSYHSMMARVHSWVYLTNNADADTSLVLNTTGSSKLEYPWGNGNFQANLTKLPTLTAPVSGVMNFTFADITPINITNLLVAIDPVFAAAPDAGWLLANGSRYTNKTLCPGMNSCKAAVNVNTTKLCNGVHRLVTRTDSFVMSPPVLANYGAGTFSAYHMITFNVQNAREAQGCRPAVPAKPAFSTAALSTAAAAGNVAGVRHAAATLKAWRAYRLAPERVVMQAQPRQIQELQVVSYYHH